MPTFDWNDRFDARLECPLCEAGCFWIPSKETVGALVRHETVGDGRLVHSRIAVGWSVHGRSVHGRSVHGRSVHGRSVHGRSVHGRSVHGRSVHGSLVHQRRSIHSGSVQVRSEGGKSVHGGWGHGILVVSISTFGHDNRSWFFHLREYFDHQCCGVENRRNNTESYGRKKSITS
jgi:hypothetical protein